MGGRRSDESVGSAADRIVIGGQICNPLKSRVTRPQPPQNIKESVRPAPHTPGHTVCPHAHRPQEKYARGPATGAPGLDSRPEGVRNFNMEMSLADQDRAITILPAEAPASQGASVPILLCLHENPEALDARRHPRPRSRRRPPRPARRSRPARERPQRRARGLLPRPGLEPAQRRPGRHRRRHGRGDERRRLPHPGAHAAPVRHRAAVHRRPAGPAGSRAHHRRRVRSDAPPESRRAAAQEHEQGHRLHDLAGAGFARAGDRGRRCSSRT